MPLLIVYLTKYRTLSASMRSPGGARTILSILSIAAGKALAEARFIFFQSDSIRKLFPLIFRLLDIIGLS